MSTVIYLILAIVTVSGILYSVTSSMENAKNNLNVISNVKKGDEIFSVLKNTVTLNSDMEIVVPMPDKNKEGNPVVPSWVYGDSQNSFGSDFLYCPFLSSGNQPPELNVVSYNSKNNDYEVSGYSDNLLAGRQYAVSASKNMSVNGENVIFAIATLNKKEKDVSCDDIFVSGKKLRIKNGKVWSFADKLFSQRGGGSGSRAVIFVSSDEQQLLKGNMSGFDKFNPTSISSALSGIMYGKYSDVNIKLYDGEYVIPSAFARIGVDKSGYELSSVKVTFESLDKTNNGDISLSSREHGVKMMQDADSSGFEFKNTELVINDVSVNFNIDLYNGKLVLNNTDIGSLSVINSGNSAIRNSRLGAFRAVNSEVLFTDSVNIDGYMTASNSLISIVSKDNDSQNMFVVGGANAIGLRIDDNSSLIVKDSFVDVSTTEDDYVIKAIGSTVSFNGSFLRLGKVGGGLVNVGVLSEGDFAFSRSSVSMYDDTSLNYGFDINSGGRVKVNSSSIFTYGNVPQLSIVDNGISFASGEGVNIRQSPVSGACWSGSIFKNSIGGLSSPSKPEIDDGYYEHNKIVNKTNWQCN